MTIVLDYTDLAAFDLVAYLTQRYEQQEPKPNMCAFGRLVKPSSIVVTGNQFSGERA